MKVRGRMDNWIIIYIVCELISISCIVHCLLRIFRWSCQYEGGTGYEISEKSIRKRFVMWWHIEESEISVIHEIIDFNKFWTKSRWSIDDHLSTWNCSAFWMDRTVSLWNGLANQRGWKFLGKLPRFILYPFHISLYIV